MPNPDWEKKEEGADEYEGVRVAEFSELGLLYEEEVAFVDFVLSALEYRQVVIFEYDDEDRVVAPFALGVSQDGNPLLRGYQLEGISRSGKGEGWRVFQVRKIVNAELNFEFFEPEDFDFEQFYPWIFKVYKMV